MALKYITICTAIIGICAGSHAVAQSQAIARSESIQTTSLTQDVGTQVDASRDTISEWPFGDRPPSLDATSGPPPDIRSLLLPRFRMSAEWQPYADGFGISSTQASMQVPLYPVFGPPPPIITTGYSYTHIQAPSAYELPTSLHEASLGVAWIRKLSDKWMARFTLSGAFASDLHNDSSDAWQLRAGAFAIYQPSEAWSFAFGALATGRDDLPVLPGIGLIWEPSRVWKINLMMPQPKVSRLLFESATWQHWGYVGGGIGGGTWAYDRSGIRDRISYNEFRLVIGWEAKPPQPPGTFAPPRQSMNIEFGYVFGREFEFDSALPEISLGNAMVLRSTINF